MKLDGANGVGADKVRRLMEHFAAAEDEQALTVNVVNDGSSGVLNYKVKGNGQLVHKVKGHQDSKLCCVTSPSVVLIMSRQVRHPQKEWCTVKATSVCRLMETQTELCISTKLKVCNLQI